MVKNQKEAIRIVKSFINSLRSDYYIKSTYIFGSFANDANLKDSDIDVGIIIEDDATIDRKKEIFLKAQHFDSNIEPIVFSEKDFLLGSSDIICEIKSKGIKIA